MTERPQDDGSGCLLASTGIPALTWDVNGEVTEDKLGTSTLPTGCCFHRDTGVFRQVFGSSLGVVYNVKTRALELYMSADGVKHCFVQGFNEARVRVVKSCC